MFNGIQGLRALAALGVVLFHAALYLRGVRDLTEWVEFFTRHFGHGVILFFSISGFVLWPSKSCIAPLEFMKRRLIRIYPPFLFCCALALGLKWALGIGSYDLITTAKALSLLPFGVIPYPLGVEWSLVYEMFFYFVLFAICFVKSARTRGWILLGWLGLLLMGTQAFPQFTVQLPDAFGVALSAISLPFVLGAVTRLMYEQWKSSLRWSASLGLSLLTITVCCLGVANWLGDLSIAYLFWGSGFSALILISILCPYSNHNRLSRVFGRWGDCSYGIYLIHFQAIGAFTRFIQHFSMDVNVMFASAVAFALLVGSAFGYAEFRFHQWLSRPARSE